jgi:hypothetical protein
LARLLAMALSRVRWATKALVLISMELNIVYYALSLMAACSSRN